MSIYLGKGVLTCLLSNVVKKVGVRRSSLVGNLWFTKIDNKIDSTRKTLWSHCFYDKSTVPFCLMSFSLGLPYEVVGPLDTIIHFSFRH